MHRIAILGASGYAGGELIRLVDGHPDLDVVYLGAHTSAGARLGDVHPHLRGGERILGPIDADGLDADLAFLALPHGASGPPALALAAAGTAVIDLGSDFRLDTPGRYHDAYGTAHPYPDELGQWVYGIPELFSGKLAGARKVAAPGCYPTSAILALAPLLSHGLIEPEGIVVDSLSGTSGAGRGAKSELMFGSVDESVRAYGVTTHRHRPEIELGLELAGGRPVSATFTPHLVPMQRGILSTCYARPTGAMSAAAAMDALGDSYSAAPFVDVIEGLPETRWVVGSNRCLITARFDERTRTVVVISAIDNLLKGAAGQAVQCANLVLGLDETAGLPLEGWMP